MTVPDSKYIPFIVLALAGGFMAVDMFTTFEITENMITIISMVLAPLGLGGLINKGWDTFKAIKLKKEV